MCRSLLPPIYHLLFLSLLFCPSASKPEQPDCVEFICPVERPLGLLRTEEAKLIGGQKCERCDQCTESGYSVCVRPMQFNSSHSVPPEGSHCECAHSGPRVRMDGQTDDKSSGLSASGGSGIVCRLPLINGRPKGAPKPKAGEGVFRVCFSSALRKMPKPVAKNNLDYELGGLPNLLVTVEEFWLSDYWKALRPADLHLFYVFPVAKEENCEGKVIVPNVNDLMWINTGKSKEEVARQKSIWLCKCSLQILMGNEDHRRHPAAELGQDDDYQMDEMEDEEEEEEGMPPEVLFERNVFAGAEKVRLYYEVTVQRDNQLKQMAGGKVKFESRKTKVQSDPLDFDLEPERFQASSTSSELRSGSVSSPHRTSLSPAGILPSAHFPREPIVRPTGRPRKLPTKERNAHQEEDGQGTSPPSDPTTAIPAPSGASASAPTTARAGRVNSAGSSGDHQQRIKEGEGDGGGEDWNLLRNVLLISLLCIAVLIGLAFCYKKGLGCFGGSRASAHNERNGKTRSANGKEYTAGRVR